MVWAMLFSFGLNVIFQDLWRIPDVFNGIQPISSWAVRVLRKWFPKSLEESKRVGLLFTLLFLCCSALLYVGIFTLFGRVLVGRFLVETLMYYQLIATGFACEESLRIFKALRARDMEGAWEVASHITPSNPWPEDDQYVVKVAIDKVVRSFEEGVIGLLFYATFGGIWLAVPYAAVNSMFWWLQNHRATEEPQKNAVSFLYFAFNFAPNFLIGWLSIIAMSMLGMNRKSARSALARYRVQSLLLHPYRALVACAGALDEGANDEVFDSTEEHDVYHWVADSQDIMRVYYAMIVTSGLALLLFLFVRAIF